MGVSRAPNLICEVPFLRSTSALPRPTRGTSFGPASGTSRNEDGGWTAKQRQRALSWAHRGLEEVTLRAKVMEHCYASCYSKYTRQTLAIRCTILAAITTTVIIVVLKEKFDFPASKNAFESGEGSKVG